MAELDPREFLFLKKINETITLSNPEGIAVDDVFAMFTGHAIHHREQANNMRKWERTQLVSISGLVVQSSYLRRGNELVETWLCIHYGEYRIALSAEVVGLW